MSLNSIFDDPAEAGRKHKIQEISYISNGRMACAGLCVWGQGSGLVGQVAHTPPRSLVHQAKEKFCTRPQTSTAGISKPYNYATTTARGMWDSLLLSSTH